jgi:hypothetical protein
MESEHILNLKKSLRRMTGCRLQFNELRRKCANGSIMVIPLDTCVFFALLACSSSIFFLFDSSLNANAIILLHFNSRNLILAVV